MKDIKTKLAEYIVMKDTIVDDVKNYIKDTSIPLEERWEVFKSAASSNILETKGWIWHSTIIENELNLDWYDDFCIERYETSYFIDIIDHLNEHDYDQEVVDRVKEDMLKSGYSGFKFDW